MALGTFAVVMLAVLAIGVSTNWFRDSFYGDGDDDDDEVFEGGGGSPDISDVESTADKADSDDGEGDDTAPWDDDSDQEDVTPASWKRVVLVEDFTNTGCPPCAQADPELDKAARDLGTGKVAYVRYHVSWPDPADPFYLEVQGDVESRVAKYSISAVPTVLADGDVVNFQYDYYGEMTDAVEEKLEVEPGFLLEAEATLSQGGSSVELEVTAERGSGGSGDAVFYALLVESDIEYNAQNGETVHNYVVKRFISSGSGEPVMLAQGEKFRFSEDVKIPDTMVVANTHIVIFVQDNRGQTVHNAMVVDLD
jgi:hypothetical protein